ncbi:MBL fold metallo-hydrolase [Gordonia neofelifaecis]|uniref:Beta-lactamase domain-containing protein n=1 Tax=Gordonia neofelifaecis NRRL B-59395 TaxID=644548 RepID=F1YM53_9ACTN|nr:MBL fold metallo-hydrolase [Gordonia neofelifaecis]EGD54304.1 beta-lactamase domain-containing protein [Gordonia neofelifaecis NRRL B-59395]
MTITHLNCGTMHPLGGTRMVCHVLLVETEGGLVLVDTGFGRRDLADPVGRLGRPLTSIIRPELAYEETALSQVEALGYDPTDVTDIVMTHLDSDHTGGIDDFPTARLHVSARELANADSEPGPSAAVRNRPWRRSKHPDDVQTYTASADDWFGFPAAALSGLGDDFAYVALPGHTEGHMGVAVRDGDGWLLHCGDAFYHQNAAQGGRVPASMAFSQFVTARRPRDARRTRRRLADLCSASAANVQLICAHDAVQFDESVRRQDA